jgi:hypothetical protein
MGKFCIEIEWLKHFTELEVCRLDTQCHTFPKWVTSISTNVQKLEPHLNPKCGKMQSQSTTLSQIVFGNFIAMKLSLHDIMDDEVLIINPTSKTRRLRIFSGNPDAISEKPRSKA